MYNTKPQIYLKINMKHKLSYPRGTFKRLYGRDVNNLKSYLSSKCQKSFIMNLCSTKCQNEFYKKLLFFRQDWIFLQMVLQEELEEHAI